MANGRRVPLKTFIAILIVGFVVALLLYLRSSAFQDRVRQAVTAKLEQSSGGKVEIGAFRWSTFGLIFTAENVTIHGSEPASTPPLFHADRLVCRLNLLSILSAKLGLKSLEAAQPRVHLISHPDGTTNLPGPKISQGLADNVSEIFDLQVERLQLNSGELIWNEQRIPLDLKANDVGAELAYYPEKRDYEGSANATKVNWTLPNARPFSSSAHFQFSLSHDQMNVSSVQLRSGASSLEASGEIRNFNAPSLAANYRLTLDGRDVAMVLRKKGIAGVLSAVGAAQINQSGFTSNGNWSINNAAAQLSKFSLNGIGARGSFDASLSRLELQKISGTWAGGVFNGDVSLRDWLTFFSSSEDSAGKVVLIFRNLNLERAPTLLPSHLRPLRFAGIVNGSVSANWKTGMKNAFGNLRLDVIAPAQPRSGYLRTAGKFDADFSKLGNEIAITTARFTSGEAQLNAAGLVSERMSDLKFQVSAPDLGQLAGVASGFDLPFHVVEMHGGGSFTGTLTGPRFTPTVDGHLETAVVDAVVQFRVAQRGLGKNRKNQQAYGTARHLRWDRLATDLSFSPRLASLRNGNLKIGSADTKFSGSSALNHYAFTPSSAFSTKISTANAQISDLLNLLGKNYPVAGTISFTGEASGTLANQQGNARFNANKGKLLGLPFNAASGNLHIAGPEESLNNFRLQLGRGSVIAGSAAYNEHTEALKFAADGNNFDLSRVPQIKNAGWSAQGSANFHLQGEGTRREPRINGAFALRNLFLNGERVGDLDLQAATTGTRMHLTAQSDFARSNLAMAGDINLTGGWPADMQLNFSHLDIDPLLTRYVHGRVTEHSSIDGKIRLRGPLVHPRQLDIAGILQNASVNIENVGLKSDGPIDFEFANSVLAVRRLHIVGQSTDFTAEGELPLQRTGDASLHAQGRLDFKILQSFDPDMVASGSTTLNVRVAGSLLAPSITGSVQINNGSMAPMDYPAGLSAINGTMAFNENRLVIQSLTAQTGGGEISLGGFITYSRGIYFDLTAAGKAIRLRYPPGVSAVANPDLRLQGTLQHSVLSGEVGITKFGLTPQFDFGYYLARSQLPPSAVPPESLLNTIHFDVHFVTSPALEVETSLARLTGDADLHLRGTAAQPIVLGRIDIAEGTISFSGTQYQLDRGSIVFSNPVRILPVVDLQASARVRDYDITLSFHGPLDKLSITYRSDPPLPPSDIIALLALGRTRQDIVLNTSPQQQSFADVTSTQLLSNALNYAQSSRVQRLFGASRIKIDPEAAGPQNNGTSRLTLEQQVSNRATLTYITNLSQSAQTVIQLEFNINRQLSLVGIRDQNGVVSFSIYLRQRKR